jgi:hypothetical protein
MTPKQILSFAALSAFAIVPVLALTQGSANAASARKADWKAPKAKKAAPAAVAETQPTATTPNAGAPASSPSLASDQVTAAAPIQDQSQEVMDMDMAMAAAIMAQGPKDGYTSALSELGILYDANGASPAGAAAANTRFANFPADVKLVRTPEKAIAAGGSGSSWGTYLIKRDETILSAGRYVSVWRRETAGWKMISELAAGRTNASPAPSAPVIGALPKRPAQLGRVTPAPVGVPLTVPTPPAPSDATETPPAP